MGWNGSKSGSKMGFWVPKWVKMRQNPLFHPLKNPLQDIHENPLFTQFKGGGSSFPKRPLRQSRPSITLEGPESRNNYRKGQKLRAGPRNLPKGPCRTTIKTIIITVSYLIPVNLLAFQLQLQLQSCNSPELISHPKLSHYSLAASWERVSPPCALALN